LEGLLLPDVRCVITRPQESWPDLARVCAMRGLTLLSVSLDDEPAPGGSASEGSYEPGGHILLTSGTTVTWAHHALLNNDRQGLKWGLIATVALGALFTAVQAYEYAHAAFAFSRDNGGNIYGSTFFMATGFHGFHVLVGTIFLLVCLFRALKGHFTPQQHFGFEAAAWYWHFVDVVWLFLFACIYVWASSGVAIMHE